MLRGSERKPIILVIEDSGDSREMLRLLLEDEGYRVLTAANGDEALERAENSPLDLIVTDFGLPDMDGMAVVRELRKLKSVKQIPIIMLTALDGDQYSAAALRAGCSDFLTKPVDVATLQAMIERLLQTSGRNQDFTRRCVRFANHRPESEQRLTAHHRAD